MGLDLLCERSLQGESLLGFQLLDLWAKSGMQAGSAIGLAISPIAWLLSGRRRSFYHDVLPRAGCAGLVGGCALGCAAVLVAAATSTSHELHAWASHSQNPDVDRLNRWATGGAGIGALFSSPGPGSVLFHNTPWISRLGGGAAVGALVGTLGALAARDPDVRSKLPASVVPKELLDLQKVISGGK